MGMPGRDPRKSGVIFFQSRSFRICTRSITVIKRPIRATRGMTVLISMKIAISGRESRTEPKPDSPWVKPAKKTIRHRNRQVCKSYILGSVSDQTWCRMRLINNTSCFKQKGRYTASGKRGQGALDKRVRRSAIEFPSRVKWTPGKNRVYG